MKVAHNRLQNYNKIHFHLDISSFSSSAVVPQINLIYLYRSFLYIKVILVIETVVLGQHLE